MAYNTVSVTTSATLIVAANPQRVGLVIFNASAQTVYYGPDTSITTSNSPALLPNTTYTETSSGDKMYQGNVYGIAGATADVRYWEKLRL